MKTIKLLLVMLLFTIAGYSQARLGYTIKQIKEDYWNKSIYKTETFTDKDTGKPYLIIKSRDWAAIYLFDNGLKCSETFIKSFSDTYLQDMIQIYNKRYVVISDNHWKYYTKYGIVEVYLKKTDKGIYYFDWLIVK